MRSLRLLAAAAAALSVTALAAPAAAVDGPAEYGPAAYGDAPVSTADVVVPMTFPVVGPVSYSDTFLACRSGCARKHFGQDLMGPKMNIAVAAFNGVVHSIERETYVGGGNYITLKGDNGWSANYIHMNNDRPGTDDGKGTVSHFTAPGIREGKRVFAGEILGWIGDSGNAEGTGPHLHFELRKGDPWSGTVYNAYASLRKARVLSKPTTSGPHVEGSYVKGCPATVSCSWWQISGGKRHLLRAEVAKELAVVGRMVVPITQNEARWYRVGGDVKLPSGRAYRGPDGKLWLVSGGRRYPLPGAAALAPLGIKATRVRTTTAAGLATVPLVAAGTPLPAGPVFSGALLRVPGSTTSYWFVVGTVRRLVSDAATLKSWGLVDADAVTLPEGTDLSALPALAAPLRYRDGALVKDALGRRYVVSQGYKRPFGSWPLFVQYGYTTVLQQTPPALALSRLPTGPRLP